ncbi:MAG: aminopeptidase [Desulfobacteraceae bacterium]|nr:aminopeptidase [Desulfobacteraceae bacterium]MCF8095045.1 aminopeptidase [Desulfobacteraceae bacterium]
MTKHQKAKKDMLKDQYLDRYAEVMLWGLNTARRGRRKKSDIILIRYDMAALPLAERLYEKLLAAGRHPVQRLMQTSNMEKRFYEIANNRQLQFIAPGEKEFYQSLNGSIVLLAPESITHLSHIDPATIGTALKARKQLRDLLDRREETGEFSWTLAVYPTSPLAEHAGMEDSEYVKQIVNACFINRTDPIAQWQSVYRKAQKIKKWLNSLQVDSLHVESENMDLEITPGEQRRWIGISGHNIPSFEIFMSPDWRGTRGIYFADQPTYRSGNLVEKIRLEFDKGKVISAEAETGEDFLHKQIQMDHGSGKIGEFSLTDRRFSKINRFMANTLYDENFGGKFGNCHIALGSSYSDTYAGDPADLTESSKKELGFNDSALHWDIVNTEKKCVTARLADGGKTVIYENGEFKI